MFLKLLVGISLVLSVVVPDPVKTPGALNPNVTQANIQKTICVSGFTSAIRPPSSYTTALKIKQLQQGYAVNGDLDTSHYEEDHLISLELGGHPTDPKNLWPEPYNDTLGARIKDRLENTLHDLVCSGAIKLKTAQTAIATNWEDAYQKYIGPLPVADSPSAAPNVAKPSASASTVAGGGSTNGAKRKLDPRFPTCKAANAKGYGPYFKAINPEYVWYTDANSDGKVC